MVTMSDKIGLTTMVWRVGQKSTSTGAARMWRAVGSVALRTPGQCLLLASAHVKRWSSEGIDPVNGPL